MHSGHLSTPITTIMATQTMTEPTQAIAAEGERSFAQKVEDPQEKILTLDSLADQETPLIYQEEVAEEAAQEATEETVEEEERAPMTGASEPS